MAGVASRNELVCLNYQSTLCPCLRDSVRQQATNLHILEKVVLCPRTAHVFLDLSTVPTSPYERSATWKFNKTTLDFKYAHVKFENL